jgi:ATP/maltotriose-dependent transcriptional regulator MalT/DNA-binding SARP family transcriptional activator
VAWYSCGHPGASIGTFSQGVIDALAETLEEDDPDVAARLRRLDSAVESAGGGMELASDVAAALGALKSDVLLIVDDAHNLGRAGSANPFLEHLVLSAPRLLHIVIASREALAFRIERLRGQGEAWVIDAATLALSGTETAALLNRELPDLPPAVAGDIQRITGGWPAAVRLTADALRASPASAVDAVRRLERHDGPLFAYLAGEVFDRETPEVRELLGVLAPYERCTIELGRTLGITDPEAILADLSARGLLVQALERDGEFRLHDLIRSVSLARWQPPVEAAEREARAAGAWYEDRGWWVDALRAFERGGDPAMIATYLERHGAQLIATGAAEALIAAAGRLQDAAARRSLDQLLGEAHVVRGESELAQRAFTRAAEGLTTVPASLAWRLGLLHHLRDDLSAALEAYERGTIDGSHPADEAMLLGWKASAHWRRSELVAARTAADQSLDLARRSGNDSALAAAHIAQAMLAASDGRRSAADSHARAAFESAGRAGDVLQLIRMHSNRGTQLDEEGEYAAAIVEFDEAIHLARTTGYASFLATATANRADSKLALGRLDEAAVDFRAAREIYSSIGSLLASFALAGLGDVQRERGDLAQARLLYAEALELAARSGTVDRLHMARLAQVRTVDDHAEARRLVHAAEQVVGVWRGRTLLAAAWVELQIGERERAREITSEALSVAESTRDRRSLAEAITLEVMAADRPADHLDRLRDALRQFASLGCEIDEAGVQLAIGLLGSGASAAAAAGRAERRLRRLGVATRPPLAAGIRSMLPDPEAPTVEIRTLGGFAVLHAGQPVPGSAWQSRHARTLLKILVTQRGRPMTREALGELLWSGEEAASLANRLSVALSTVRTVLDPERRSGPDEYIAADGDTVSVRTDRLTCDLETFHASARGGHDLRRGGDREAARDLLEIAEQTYVGEFLEDEPYADWATTTREAGRSEYVAVARALASLATESGDHDTAVRYTLRLLERDPFEEEANLNLVVALDGLGRHGEARHRYEGYVARMREIDVEPAPYPVSAANPLAVP